MSGAPAVRLASSTTRYAQVPNQVPARHVQKLLYHGGYNPSGTHVEQRAERIILKPPCEPSMLPVQERYRMILKKERFGGTCDIMMMAKNKTGKEDMLVS